MQKYEKIEIEIIKLSDSDVIMTSNPFDGEDDSLDNWS